MEKLKQHNSSWKQELKIEAMKHVKEEINKQLLNLLSLGMIISIKEKFNH